MTAAQGRALLGEAVRSARSHAVPSLVILVVVAAMCVTVLLTTGRTVGAQEAIRARISTWETRTLIVQAPATAGLDSAVLGRLSAFDAVEVAAAFGPATDVRSVPLPATPVAMRTVWLDGVKIRGLPRGIPLMMATACATTRAATELRMSGVSGEVVSADGRHATVAARCALPRPLRFLDPSVLTAGTAVGPIATLVVVAHRESQVAGLRADLVSVLGVQDRSGVEVTTTGDLARLGALIRDDLRGYGRTLVWGLLGITGVLVGAAAWAAVMMRRRDYGRRRALGAPRILIAQLVLLQTLIVSVAGALVGDGVAALVLLATADPSPPIAYWASLDVAAIEIALIAAVLPAVAAARRDPLRELRVP